MVIYYYKRKLLGEGFTVETEGTGEFLSHKDFLAWVYQEEDMGRNIHSWVKLNEKHPIRCNCCYRTDRLF